MGNRRAPHWCQSDQKRELRGAVRSQAHGWWAITSEKLSKAILANESPWSGKTTLHLQQTEPVVFPPASYTDPNYDQFLRDANEGKGGAFVQVTQEIPVVGGQSYSLRWHSR